MNFNCSSNSAMTAFTLYLDFPLIFSYSFITFTAGMLSLST